MKKALAGFLACVVCTASHAQFSLAPPATPPVRQQQSATTSDFRRVLLRTPNSRTPVVARVLKNLGNGVAVELPNGAIQFVDRGRFQPTDDAFKPRQSTELQRELSTEYPGFKVAAKGHFVFVYNTQDSFCEFTSQRLEATYSSVLAYCNRHHFSTSKPVFPLVIVLFETKDQFLKAGGLVASQLDGYYSGRDNRTRMYQYRFPGESKHKAAYRCELAIAHEGVHQILHNIGVQRRLSEWPLWISEGLAEYFVPAQSHDGVVAGNPNLERILELLSATNSRSKAAASRWELNQLGTGKVITKLVDADDLDSYGYAIAWSLTHYLATNRTGRFERYIKDVAQAKPFAKLSRPEIDRYKKHFGPDLPGIEESLVRHVRKLREEAANVVYLVIGSSPNGATAAISPTPNVDELQKTIANKLGYPKTTDVQFYVKKYPTAAEAKTAILQLRRSVAKPIGAN